MRATLTAETKDVLHDAIAPVRSDGTFAIDGVLRGKMTLVARQYGIDLGDEPLHIDIAGDIHDLALTAQVARPIAPGPSFTRLCRVLVSQRGHLPPVA